MIGGKAIAVGDVIQMPKLTGDKPFRVIEVKDGKVTVQRDKDRTKGRWWLPYQTVREDGVMVKRGRKMKETK